jgi:hypothetical protein
MAGLRGEVTTRWKTARCPQWDYEMTKNVCLEVNRYFAKSKRNPAPRFREEIEKGNDVYVKQWVMGCHFDWLNPR